MKGDAIHRVDILIFPVALEGKIVAVVPLVLFTANRGKMGALVIPRWLACSTWGIAGVIIVFNAKLLWDLAMGA